jgi:SAM-dependent methyltransferase
VPEDRLSEIYPANYYAYGGSRDSAVERVKQRLDERMFRRILQQMPGDDLSILDVGGGDGWLLTILRGIDLRIGWTEVVDMDPNAEQAARQEGHAYFRGRVEDFSSERSYDLILMLNILEHLGDPRGVLAQLRSRLTTSGVILVKTPNLESLDSRWFRHRNWGGYHCPRHWVLFDRESLISTANDVGLSVRRMAYTQGAPFWAVSVLAWLTDRRLVTINQERPAVQHPLFPVLTSVFAGGDLVRARAGAKTSQMFFELVPGEV